MSKETSQLEIVISAKDEASKKISSIGDKLSSISKVSAVAGAAIFGSLGLMAKGAMEAEESTNRVTTTLEAMGEAALKNKDAIMAAAQATVSKGFDDEAAAESITRLYQRTGDLSQATKLNALAMDLARKKNMDLSSASQMVGMVLSGNSKVLKQYGIDIKESASPLAALDELQKKVAGSADAFANTSGGKMIALKETYSNLSDSIGANLLPVMNQLLGAILPIVEKVAEWIAQNPELAKNITLVVAGLGALLLAIGFLTPVISAITFAVGLFGTVMTFIAANPIVLVILAIAALVAGIVWLIKHWDEVSAKVIEVWTIIATWIKTKTEEIKANILEWVEGIKTTVSNAFNAVKATMEGVWNGIKSTVGSAIQYIIDKVTTLINKLKELASAMANSTVGKAVGGIASGIGGVVNSVKSFVSGKKAGGGIVNAGSSYLVGEKGPEMFTPSNTGRITPNGGMGGGLTVVIQGNSFMGESDMAVRVGDMIVNRLKLQAKLSI